MLTVAEIPAAAAGPLVPATGLLSWRDPSGRLGWSGLQFYLATAHGVLTPVAGGSNGCGAAVWQGRLDERLTVRLAVATSPSGAGWVVTPTLCNDGTTPVAFTGYGFRPAAGTASHIHEVDEVATPVYAHSQNLRYERLPVCAVAFPFIRPLPPEPLRVGDQASGPVPALLLGRAGGRHWLLEAAFTQDRHVLSWQVGMATRSGGLAACRSEFTWTGGHPELVPAQGECVLESLLFRVVEAAPDALFAAYAEELAAEYGARFAGVGSRLAREPVYCTWNFGVATHLDEEVLRRRMAIAAAVQGGGFFQLDHGYQPPLRPGEGPSGELDVYYPDPERAWDRSRFPGGPRGFVADCRRHGLRPALWWSPRLARSGPLATAHPEWLLRDRDGKPIDVGHYCPDPSVPAVREFFEYCLDTIVHTWGFEGLKLDFFSYLFDHHDAVFRHGGTGPAWKRWLLARVRRALGPAGYFLHCISCPLGNPFLALEGCDAFRAGIDIDRGDWGHHVRGSAWLLPAMLATGAHTWFGNIDSILGHPEIPLGERRFRGAFAYLTGGMFEFSGPLEQLEATALADYRRLVERLDQGQGPFACPDAQAFYGRPLPSLLVRQHAPGSRTREQHGIVATVGCFNWGERPLPLACDLAEFGRELSPGTWRDFWTGAPLLLASPLLATQLPPRGHLLADLYQTKSCPRQQS